MKTALMLTFGALGACAPSSYTPGALTDPPPGLDLAYANARRVSDCLDLAAWTIPASEGGASHGVELQIDTGNRCDRAVDLDLRQVMVTGSCGGAAVALWPADPEDAPPPRRIAPHRTTSARLLFETPVCPGATRVCVDVSAVTRAAAPATPICFPS
jgi:hypothetical protein